MIIYLVLVSYNHKYYCSEYWILKPMRSGFAVRCLWNYFLFILHHYIAAVGIFLRSIFYTLLLRKFNENYLYTESSMKAVSVTAPRPGRMHGEDASRRS